MSIELTRENVSAVMDAYHGFHDANIISVIVRPESGVVGYLDVEVELLARNFQNQDVENVKLLLWRVIELKLYYHKEFDYPCVRDDIAIGFFDELVFVDFGSACEPRESPEAFRSAYSYFVCESVSFEGTTGFSTGLK
ncbi:MAG TPA: hypothetical protein PLY87_13020 [Planctomycetaceae bacterium]|nr:hypothetical protein [Planctomycetaceae bacterium]